MKTQSLQQKAPTLFCWCAVASLLSNVKQFLGDNQLGAVVTASSPAAHSEGIWISMHAVVGRSQHDKADTVMP